MSYHCQASRLMSGNHLTHLAKMPLCRIREVEDRWMPSRTRRSSSDLWISILSANSRLIVIECPDTNCETITRRNHFSFVRHRRDNRPHLLDTLLDGLQLVKDRGAIARTCPSLELQRFVHIEADEQISKRHLERLRDSNERCEPKVFPSGFEMADKCSVHLEVIRQRFLRSKAALYADVAYPLPEAAKYLFHVPSVKGGLPNSYRLIDSLLCW
jgi:hypothetical protein